MTAKSQMINRKTLAEAESISAEHFKISRYPKRNTSQQAGVSFWRRHPDSNWGWSFCRALPYHLAMSPYGPRTEPAAVCAGAGDEARTRYLHLGKVALYQMSYIRKWCLRPESNQRHGDFQSPALPTELQRQTINQNHAYTIAYTTILENSMATRIGLEPTTSSVTG